MAVKTKNISNLQRQLDAAFPNRKKPDGWIGDAAHRARTSGHNPDDTAGSKPAWDGDPDTVAEVRDIDISDDFGGDVTGQQFVDHMVSLPGIATVFRYFIYDGHIWHARDGFKKAAFAGDPHPDHIHGEGAWSQDADNNATFDFRLEEITMGSAWAEDVIPNPKQRADSATNKTTQASFALGDMWQRVYDLRDAVAAQGKALTAAIQAVAAKDVVDEDKLAAALVPGVAAAVVAALPEDRDDITVTELAEAIRSLIQPSAPAA